MNKAGYSTVLTRAEAEIIEKKSRFIATAMPVKDEQEALLLIEELRKRHYNAAHNVYAYILGRNMEVQRFSDDGEPNGTAGMPVLNVLKGEGLVDVIVIVTRYFGGILLGAGGLVRAYSKAAKSGIDAARVIRKEPFSVNYVTVSYHLSGKTQYEILNQNFTISDISYDIDVTYKVLVEVDRLDFFVSMINDATGADALIDTQETLYFVIIDGKPYCATNT